ncbi:MAG: M48 family metallopeptidase [Pseudoflavonifractor sp.]|nr:M48 family metallopeptidase [Alloprevotella sp.]MCM1116699.1 M48 family metallopeptidase [Pseudoflavonifractor sp.]
MTKGYLDHPRLGRVYVTINPRARRFIARWQSHNVALTVPSGQDMDAIMRALDNMADDLLSHKPAESRLVPGTVMEFADFILEIKPHPAAEVTGGLTVRAGKYVIKVRAWPHTEAGEMEERIVRIIHHISKPIAERTLLPRARQIAEHLGIKGVSWEIGRGVRRLGCCSLDGRISLSRFCIFLPWRLRDYVICHELAHLTHFNHSAEFHALCSRYCGGDGDQRRAELKAFAWPVPRR